jgi:hypothetical protein
MMYYNVIIVIIIKNKSFFLRSRDLLIFVLL